MSFKLKRGFLKMCADMRSEVLTAMKVSMFIFWVESLCGLVRRYILLEGYIASIFSAELRLFGSG
jgi:hypothetical protein